MTKTDEEKLADRKRKRELQEQGFVRVVTETANLALRFGVQLERGPSIPGVATDRGLWVPAWFQWYIERFPRDPVQQRQRLEELEALKSNKEEQYLLLVEANLIGGTLYDPSGDLGTRAAQRILAKELGYGEED